MAYVINGIDAWDKEYPYTVTNERGKNTLQVTNALTRNIDPRVPPIKNLYLNKLKSISAFSFSFFSIYINKPKEQKETENIIIEFIYLYELSWTIFEIPIRKLLTKNIKIIVALGKVAFDACFKFYKDSYNIKKVNYKFSHGVRYLLPDNKLLIGCYHPSPRNVNTNRININKMVKLWKYFIGLQFYPILPL